MAVRRKKGGAPTPPHRVSRNPPAEATFTWWLVCAPCGGRAEIASASGGQTGIIPTDLDDRCPRCGQSAAREMTVTIDNADEMVDGLSGIRVRGRTVGPPRKLVLDHTDKVEVFRETGEQRHILRTYDYANNLYANRYTDVATGRVVKETCEPLTEHRGHGSARRKPGADGAE